MSTTCLWHIQLSVGGLWYAVLEPVLLLEELQILNLGVIQMICRLRRNGSCLQSYQNGSVAWTRQKCVLLKVVPWDVNIRDLRLGQSWVMDGSWMGHGWVMDGSRMDHGWVIDGSWMLWSFYNCWVIRAAFPENNNLTCLSFYWQNQIGFWRMIIYCFKKFDSLFVNIWFNFQIIIND